jgi:signal-transduction protein with cAMP-binding, CBS, and nucleotidyltransferase domain
MEKAPTSGMSALDKNKMMQEGWAGKKVRDLMTTRLETCSETDTLQIAAGKMKSSSVGCLGVLSNNQIIGVLTDRDIVTRCLAEGKAYQTTKVGECMTRGAVTVSPDDTMGTSTSLPLSSIHHSFRVGSSEDEPAEHPPSRGVRQELE